MHVLLLNSTLNFFLIHAPIKYLPLPSLISPPVLWIYLYNEQTQKKGQCFSQVPIKQYLQKAPSMEKKRHDFGHAFSFASNSSRGMYPPWAAESGISKSMSFRESKKLSIGQLLVRACQSQTMIGTITASWKLSVNCPPNKPLG